MKIYNRPAPGYSHHVLFEDDYKTMRKTLEHAVRMQANLLWADLSGVDLSGAILANSDLSSVLYCVDFSGSNLTGAMFDHSIVFFGMFYDCEMPGVSFRDARLGGCEFVRSNLIRADFSDVYKSPSFMACDLTEAKFPPQPEKEWLRRWPEPCKQSIPSSQ